ncbi:hypothetical protein Y5W_02893 [Alcanivorax sp. 521-1]|uniref:Uncharacterized protein n=1 Tax=Alloalcanivorax profundimaris TaxID=2735259 RepID=A0ABS0ATZ3_9GAMM|nr:hypothetical protein [Alloalcanivorax profundimaris]
MEMIPVMMIVPIAMVMTAKMMTLARVILVMAGDRLFQKILLVWLVRIKVIFSSSEKATTWF